MRIPLAPRLGGLPLLLVQVLLPVVLHHLVEVGVVAGGDVEGGAGVEDPVFVSG